MNLQNRYDLEIERDRVANDLRQIKPFAKRREALRELLNEHVAEFGEFSSEEIAEARKALRGPAD